MKLVPEDSPVPSREEQLAALRAKLAGHRAFANIRGTMGEQRPLISLVDEMMDEAGSPSDFTRRWQQHASDIAVVSKLLAQLVRDRHEDAERELRQALCDPSYLIDGEVIPLEDLVPVTILTINFPLVFALARWIRGGDPLHDLPVCAVPDGSEDHRLILELCRHLPGLRTTRDLSGVSLMGLYEEACKELFGHYFHNLRFIHDAYACSCVLSDGTYGARFGRLAGGFVMARVYACEQSVLLASFSRDMQKLLTSWQCRMPRIMLNAPHWWKHLMVGFHPEAEHASWQNRAGLYTSAGNHHGYGVVLSDRRHHEPGDYVQFDEDDCIRESNGRIRYPVPDCFRFALSSVTNG